MYPETQLLIQQKMQAGVYPGVVYTLIEDGKSETHALGLAQVEPTHVLMEPDKLFDVASLTKVVCTTTVMLKLFEQGKLTWDQPLCELLPQFQNQTITLRHLLTHTSDIQTYIPNRDQLDAKELRAAYLTLQPGKHLGQVVKYTDAGTILLGFLIEELYQQDVVTVFKQEVLAPLGMTDSLFLPTHITDRIVPTEKLADGRILKGETHDPKARVLAEHAGNAGLFTTNADLQKFCALYLNEGFINGKQFLQPATIDSLLYDQTPNQKGDRSLGWDLKHSLVDQQNLLFHTGYTGTFLLLDVKRHGAFIFLSNRVHPIDRNPSYLKNRDEILAHYLIERKNQFHL